MLFSAIVLTCNRAKVLARTLSSLAKIDFLPRDFGMLVGAFGLRRLVEDNGLEVDATDKRLPHCRTVDVSERGHDVYVVIALLTAKHTG